MRLQKLGVEGIQARVAQIQERLRQLNPESVNGAGQIPAFQDDGMSVSGFLKGTIGKTPSGPMAPMNPFGKEAEVEGFDAAPGGIRPMIQDAAKKHSLDGRLLEALVSVESSFNPTAVSKAGAKGLTQLMPGTAAALGVTDPFDPAQNLAGGAKYLSQMLKQFDGNTELALAAYNAGPGAVKRHGGIPPFSETRSYVQNVMARYKNLSSAE